MFRIRDILVRIRIRIWIQLRILLFLSVTWKEDAQKNKMYSSVFAYYFWRYIYCTSIFMDKSHNEVTKELKSKFFLRIRIRTSDLRIRVPKNWRILWIRIRNTEDNKGNVLGKYSKIA